MLLKAMLLKAMPLKTRPPTDLLLTDADDVTIMGIRIANRSSAEAVELMMGVLSERQESAALGFLVNAHTLNLTSHVTDYARVIQSARWVFGDGTGVRWAARMRGVRMRSNLVGTDLVPRLMEETAGAGYRYFLLGGEEEIIRAASESAAGRFSGWTLAGHHDGYFADDEATLIEEINAAAPDMLLVGMGNPLQEMFLWRNRDTLRVPLCIGVGGIFHHWAGDLTRAPSWVRAWGMEWVQLLLQQPAKWRRYVFGNPAFLARAVRSISRDLEVDAHV